ncbi:hypothetical protein HS7_06510 [Sulfolobales archaeon HS-7]|nr:hypothetical protein HS7_06510 [Sulfolobales archaeon HS-7]
MGVRIEVVFGEEPKDATQELVEDLDHNIVRREDLWDEKLQEDAVYTRCKKPNG